HQSRIRKEPVDEAGYHFCGSGHAQGKNPGGDAAARAGEAGGVDGDQRAGVGEADGEEGSAPGTGRGPVLLRGWALRIRAPALDPRSGCGVRRGGAITDSEKAWGADQDGPARCTKARGAVPGE